HRRTSDTVFLTRSFPFAVTLGGACVGALSINKCPLSALGNGTGIVLAVA
ncbi:hypothetical protein K432DRAFT_309314, partial [Lepidopterella palustris CBS 459.81]